MASNAKFQPVTTLYDYLQKGQVACAAVGKMGTDTFDMDRGLPLVVALLPQRLELGFSFFRLLNFHLV